MGKLQFTIRRIFQLVLTLWAIGTILFALFRLMPGDPTSYIISPQMDAESRQQIIEMHGLHEPLHLQYIAFLSNAATLQFGQSFHSNEPVQDILFRLLPNTLVLMLSAFIVAYILGVTIGIISGWNRDSRFERTSIVVALISRSMPTFWVGIIVLWIAGAGLGIIPMAGMRSAGSRPESFLDMITTLDFLHHLIAPAAVLAFYYMGYPLLLMRNNMLEVLAEDFIDVCKAKGLKDRTVMFKHAARNAMLPVVTAAAIALGYAIGGSVLIETVYGWPGLGREMVRAVLRRDYPVAQGAFLLLAASVVFMNFIADLMYSWLDPRVTYD